MLVCYVVPLVIMREVTIISNNLRERIAYAIYGSVNKRIALSSKHGVTFVLGPVGWPCELPDEMEIFGTEISLCVCALHRVDKKKGNFILEQALKSQKGVETKFYSLFNLGASLGVGGQRQAPTAETDPVPIVPEAGWAPGPVWTGAENLVPPLVFDPRTIQPIAGRRYPGP